MKIADSMRQRAVLCLTAGLLAWSAAADAARISDVRGTRHNLSAAPDASTYTYIDPTTRQSVTGTVPARTVKANTETQVCVFCHTPHAATAGMTPLWNRQRSPQDGNYTVYTSETLDATVIQGQLQQPGGTSKLCLSCHDGSLAIGNVNVLNGVANPTIAMQGVDASGRMPPGASGETSGFTRKIGIDLRNDHPISVEFTDQLAVRDGELRRLTTAAPAQRYPVDGSVIGVRAPGLKPMLPLEPLGAGGVGQVQCGTCHDPHLRETDAAKGEQKFLRQPRFQETDPSSIATAGFTQEQDIICIGCHDKNFSANVWAWSAHARQAVADETYKATAAATRDFPNNLPVWRASCLNCHDTHTVQGSRRLLREGTDAVGVPKQGGNPAIEETCYQCHSAITDAANVLNALGSVPNVKTDFTTRLRRMPISNADQGQASEVHEISATAGDPGFVNCSALTDAGCGADFIETRARLGLGNLANRHAECTDCHNPHRVIKGQKGITGALSAANTNEKAGTHRHEDATGYVHDNLISGVLRGTFGVEPINYASNSFHSMPTSFLVKRGDPGTNPSTALDTATTYVTREYQICLKCHSNYAYNDDNLYPNSIARPQLTGTGGRTASNVNGHTNFTSYTNQAKEFQAPSTHAIAVGSQSLGCDGGAGPAVNCVTSVPNANNHRSWHPVMRPTGRTGRQAAGFRAPWNNAGALGNQTMYCSDCHGSATTGETAMPTGNTNTNEDGAPWGPHGSDNNFLLKGDYSTATGSGQQATGLCFKCHNYNSYAVRGGTTGFTTGRGDGHDIHADKIGGSGIRCNFCHVAVPHGWKNRNLLVNLNDVGAEAGLAAGTSVTFANNQGYTNGPYYRRSFLRVISFPSGQWQEGNCNGGSKDTMITQCGSPN